MKKNLVLGSFVAAALVGAYANAAPKQQVSAGAAQTAADQAPANPEQNKLKAVLRRTYSDGQFTEVGNGREVNGVRVHDFEVKNQFGTAHATLTEDGDFLISGIPHNPQRLPGPVSAAINRLFNGKPEDVDQYTVTNYLVDLDTGNNHKDRIVLDAVGRIRDIHTGTELRHMEESIGKTPVTDKTQNERMEKLVDRFYGEKAKVDSIFKDPTVENFYIVNMTTDQGKKVTLVTNGNDIFSRRVEIEGNQVPAAVGKTISETFKNAKVTAAFRRRYEFYSLDVPASNNEKVALKIGTDGDVLSVQSQSQQEEQQAAHREMQGGTAH